MPWLRGARIGLLAHGQGLDDNRHYDARAQPVALAVCWPPPFGQSQVDMVHCWRDGKPWGAFAARTVHRAWARSVMHAPLAGRGPVQLDRNHRRPPG